MMAADKRLAELRRVIEQVAAEADTRETGAEASPGADRHLDENQHARDEL